MPLACIQEWFYLICKKAFDTVEHHIFCNKLKFMGIDKTDWFMPYLQDRKQLVIVGKTLSDPNTVTCGVLVRKYFRPLIVFMLCQ